MKRSWMQGFGTACALAAASAAQAAPVMMSSEWAKEACTAWNADNSLTVGLKDSGWTANDAGRGYKVIHVYRTDCKDSKPVELRIATKEAKATCVYGGAVEKTTLDGGADYLMHADTPRWVEMGKGEYGPFKAMLFGRLQFKGPSMEAMANMGPFQSFLLLVGKVPSDAGSCPQ